MQIQIGPDLWRLRHKRVRVQLGKVVAVLGIMAAVLGIALGANFLSHQSWGGGDGQEFTCDQGQTMTWLPVSHHGSTWTRTSWSNQNSDLVLECR